MIADWAEAFDFSQDRLTADSGKGGSLIFDSRGKLRYFEPVGSL